MSHVNCAVARDAPFRFQEPSQFQQPCCPVGSIDLARIEQLSSMIYTWYDEGQCDKIENFLSTLDSPTLINMLNCEKFVIAYLRFQIYKGEFQSVCDFISSANPDKISRSTLISLWDETHYAEKQRQIGDKKLTPLIKFRVRMRHVPPPNLCPTGKRDMPSFPETARRILQDWLDHHFAYPYPNQQEKESLSRSTGLTVQQVSTWYANHRRRLRQKGLLNTKMTHGCISSGPTKRQASQQSYEHQMKSLRMGPSTGDLPSTRPMSASEYGIYSETAPLPDDNNNYMLSDSGIRMESPRAMSAPPLFGFNPPTTTMYSNEPQKFTRLPYSKPCSESSFQPIPSTVEDCEQKPQVTSDGYVLEQNFSQKIFIPSASTRSMYPASAPWSDPHVDEAPLFGQYPRASKNSLMPFDWPYQQPCPAKERVSLPSKLPDSDMSQFSMNTMWKPPQFSAPQPSSKFFPTPTQQPDLLSKANIAHVTLPNHILMQSPPSKSESVVCNNPHRPVPTFWNNLDTPQREESGSPLSTVSMVSNSPIAVPSSPTPASSHIPWFPEMNPPSSPFSPGPLATSSPKEVKPLPTSIQITSSPPSEVPFAPQPQSTYHIVNVRDTPQNPAFLAPKDGGLEGGLYPECSAQAAADFNSEVDTVPTRAKRSTPKREIIKITSQDVLPEKMDVNLGFDQEVVAAHCLLDLSSSSAGNYQQL